MFEKIFNIFKKYEVTNDEKFKQFHEFHKWLIENMPEKLKQAYNNSGNKRINAVTNKDGWSVELSIKDYLWWETQYNSCLLDMKDIDVIKREMLSKLASILGTITLDENDKELYEIIFENFSESK